MHRSVFAILGAGNEAQGLAGVLALRAYDVRVYNRSDARLAPLRQAGGIQLTGAIEGFARPRLLTPRMEEAVDGADIVMIPIPAYGHRFMSETLAPIVRPGQIVIFQPGSLGSGLECLRRLGERGVHDVVVAETETCLCTARIVGPAEVNVRAIKQQVRVAAVPATATGTVVEQLRAPFEDHYAAAENVLEIALNNGNPVYHCAPSLCNFGRIEAGEDWAYYQFMTPGVARLVDRLDRERVALARALGIKTMSFWDFLAVAYGVKSDDPVERVRQAYNRGAPTRSPKSPEDRYIVEDVPFGLVPWASLARQVDVPTPTMDAMIQTASGLYGRDFRAEGRTVESMGLAGLSAEEIRSRFERGLPPA